MEKKIAIVTGASRGIGRAIAKRLAEERVASYVIGTATTEKGAEAITAEFQQAHLAGVGRVLNIQSRESIEAFLEEVRQAHQTDPLILINNAGINRDNLLLRMKDEEWVDVLATNLTGTFYITRACLKGMVKARFGRIINISSIVGSFGNAGQTNYAASKGALNAFTKSLAKEIGSRGITVNAVAPGFIRTDMTDEMTDQQREAIMHQVPMKRIGEPHEVAALVAFLASDAASYLTGEIIHIDGGL